MSNLNRGLKYLVVLLIYGIVLYLGTAIEDYCRELSNRTNNIFYSVAALAVFPILFGMSLSIPDLISKVRKAGKWNLDRVKLVFVGLPTFIMSMMPFIYFFTPIGKFLPLAIFFSGHARPYQVIFAGGTVCGYILLNSFEKVEGRI